MTTDSRRRRRVAVIGAGIAGLAAAEALLAAQPDLDVVVYEGSREVGGKLRLGEVAGVAVDLGAESMLNRRPEATELARRVGLADAVVHPESTSAGVWTRGAVRRLPPTLMGIPADLQAAAEAGILDDAGVQQAAAEHELAPVDVSADIGVGRLVASRLGPDVRDRLVEPLLGGVYAGRADELSLHATLPQVVSALRGHGGLLAAAASATTPAATQAGRPAAPPVFAGISGGVGRLAVEVGSAITSRGGRIVCSATVRGLHRHGDGWQLVIGPTVSEELVDADAVIIAVPAPAARRLLSTAVPLAARELAAVEYASVALVTLAFHPGELATELTGSGFLVPPVDGRLIKAATYSSRKWAWLGGGPLIVRCSIGRHRDVRELQRDNSELIQGAVMDLQAAVGLRAPLLDAHVTRWGGGLPQYAVGHLDRVRRIREAVQQVPGLAVCGAAYDGVGIPAVIASSQLAATQVSAGLPTDATMDS